MTGKILIIESRLEMLERFYTYFIARNHKDEKLNEIKEDWLAYYHDLEKQKQHKAVTDGK